MTSRRRSREEQLRRLVSLQDRERRWLACEIHDGFVQDVVGAQLAIDALLERLLHTDPDAIESLLRIRALVRHAIEESRQLVGELRPPQVDDLSLVEAIQYLVHREEMMHRLDVQFSASLQLERLEPLLQTTLIRIVQESLHNIARHAQTQEAEIKLTETPQAVKVVVSDHGVGFDPRTIPADRYGIAGIRERARLFGGQATIRSRPGHGTVVTAVIPKSESGGRR